MAIVDRTLELERLVAGSRGIGWGGTAAVGMLESFYGEWLGRELPRA